MRYVINVTLNGNRFFSTNRKAAIQDQQQAMIVASGLKAGFPESQGYAVEVFEITTNANTATQLDTTGLA